MKITVKKLIIYAVIIMMAGLGAYKIYKELSKPLPGTSVAVIGETHIPAGQKATYNSNPPTSGSHYETWIKAGIYDTIPIDEELVHSLEHGYIIISYNCDIPEQNAQQSGFNIPSAYAHIEVDTAESSPAANQPHLEFEQWKTDENCKKSISMIEKLVNEVRLWKLIVTPRPSLTSRYALTAWGKIDTFSSLDNNRIKSFIAAYRDRGPEKTME